MSEPLPPPDAIRTPIKSTPADADDKITEAELKTFLKSMKELGSYV